MDEKNMTEYAEVTGFLNEAGGIKHTTFNFDEMDNCGFEVELWELNSEGLVLFYYPDDETCVIFGMAGRSNYQTPADMLEIINKIRNRELPKYEDGKVTICKCGATKFYYKKPSTDGYITECSECKLSWFNRGKLEISSFDISWDKGSGKDETLIGVVTRDLKKGDFIRWQYIDQSLRTGNDPDPPKNVRGNYVIEKEECDKKTPEECETFNNTEKFDADEKGEKPKPIFDVKKAAEQSGFRIRDQLSFLRRNPLSMHYLRSPNIVAEVVRWHEKENVVNRIASLIDKKPKEIWEIAKKNNLTFADLNYWRMKAAIGEPGSKTVWK